LITLTPERQASLADLGPRLQVSPEELWQHIRDLLREDKITAVAGEPSSASPNERRYTMLVNGDDIVAVAPW
jgi:hypothetical protein